MRVENKWVIVDGNKTQRYRILRGEANLGNGGKTRYFLDVPGYGKRGKPFNAERCTIVE